MFYQLAPVRVTAPAALPVSVAEAKAHLRVDHSDDDTLIAALIGAATQRLDGFAGVLGRCLITQTWRQDFPDFPARAPALRLPFPGPSSVVVKYSDAANAEQTLSPSVYHVIDDVIGGAITLASGQSWPATYDRPDAVRVTFNAGYGAAADVPEPIKAAIKMMIGDMYRNRETAAAGQISQIPMSTTVDILTAPYKRTQVV